MTYPNQNIVCRLCGYFYFYTKPNQPDKVYCLRCYTEKPVAHEFYLAVKKDTDSFLKMGRNRKGIK
ncbi:MAG: hypothetical protein HQ591_05360 [candidate division Zixibacteria bacterium]|nr:hypothetical protein [Candidatus Tariuqbacter arcticus]